MDKDEPNNKLPSEIEEELTPWQIENQKYLESLKEEVVDESEQDGASNKDQQPIDSENDNEESDQVNNKSKLKLVLNRKAKKVKIKEQEQSEEPDENESSIKELPKSVSFADRLPKMKETRQKRLKRRLVAIVGVFGIGALSLMYYISPLSKVSKVYVTGTRLASKDKVVSSLNLSSSDFIWEVYGDKTLEKKIKESNPRIKNVEKSLKGINSIKLEVEEFEEVAYLKEGKELYPILENGTIIKDKDQGLQKSFPILIGFKEGNALVEFIKNYQKVPMDVKEKIVDITSAPTKDNEYLLMINMNDKNKVVASSQDFHKKIKYYNGVAKEITEPSLIDMEAGIFSRSFDSIAKEEAEKEAASGEQPVEGKVSADEQEPVFDENGNVIPQENLPKTEKTPVEGEEEGQQPKKEDTPANQSIEKMVYEDWLNDLKENGVGELIEEDDSENSIAEYNEGAALDE